MPPQLDFSALLSDPAFAEEIAKQAQAEEQAKAIQQQEQLAQSIQTTPMQPPVSAEVLKPVKMSMPEMQQEMYRLMQQSMGGQKEQIEALKQAVAKEQERQAGAGILGKLDLRPFAQAAQAYGATNVAIPAGAPEDRTEMLRKLQKELTTAKGGLTDDQIAFMKTVMEDKKTAQADLSRRNAEVRETKMVVDPLLKLNAQASEVAQNVGQIESVVSQKEIPVQELKQVITKFGKIMGEVGAQTENDRLAYYTPTIEAQVETFFNRLGNVGTVSASDPGVLALVNQLRNIRAQASDGVRRKAMSIREAYGSPGSILAYQFEKGKPGEAAYSGAVKFADTLMGAPKQAKAEEKKESKGPTPSGTPQKDIMSMTKEELKQYLGK